MHCKSGNASVESPNELNVTCLSCWDHNFMYWHNSSQNTLSMHLNLSLNVSNYEQVINYEDKRNFSTDCSRKTVEVGASIIIVY